MWYTVGNSQSFFPFSIENHIFFKNTARKSLCFFIQKIKSLLQALSQEICNTFCVYHCYLIVSNLEDIYLLSCSVTIVEWSSNQADQRFKDHLQPINPPFERIEKQVPNTKTILSEPHPLIFNISLHVIACKCPGSNKSLLDWECKTAHQIHLITHSRMSSLVLPLSSTDEGLCADFSCVATD